MVFSVFSFATMADTLPLAYFPLFLHCLIGLVAAQVAHRKGYDLGLWLVWGMVGGTVALIDAWRRPRRLPPL
ncbi:hypothetical protein [Leptolyngbya sp. KIOST-1]|uniref:hypothetical protein n=1 Tax=Leptolyngbya sp. KIOST-1 TaxID=1229172 RepID=UPI000B2B5217|nr:hypothetical protein [Leptolyngbya sp. KIOST-1]